MLFAVCAMVTVQAQPGMGGMRMGGGMPMGMPMGGMRMGGMMPGMMSGEKPFFELESDSIVQTCLYDLPFFLESKKSEKFSKLVKMEYEEVCRSIQMSVIENLITNQLASEGRMGFGMTGNGEPQDLDQAAIRKNVESLTSKFQKKYRKLLEPEQLEQWNAIQDKRYGRGLGYLLAHVYDNTSIDF